MKKNKNKLLLWMTYAYLVLPFLCFFIGWCRWYYAIIFSICVIITMIKCTKNAIEYKFEIQPRRFLILICIIITIVLLSGIGSYVWQNSDHLWRNEIFEILVQKSWPVKKVCIGEETITRGLIYYIGFWLPSAVIGKIFGMSAGYFAQFIWACIGVFLVWIYISCYCKKYEVKTILYFVFFSGLDIIGHFLRGDFGCLLNCEHLEWWGGAMQFSSFTTQLFWVFNQAIYAWLITLLILQELRNNRIIFLWGCGLMTCTLPFVGMIPFLIWRIIKNIRTQFIKDKNINLVLRDLFTFENIFGGGCIGIISFLYLKGNGSGQQVQIMLNNLSIKGILVYCAFIFLEVGVYYILIYPYKHNTLFWISFIILCICPWIQIGSGIDFCMRASIPALVVLFLLVKEAWEEYYISINKLYKLCGRLLIAVFLIGALTPIHEIGRTILNTGRMIVKEGKVQNDKKNEDNIFLNELGNNFSGDIDSNLFYKYIAK